MKKLTFSDSEHDKISFALIYAGCQANKRDGSRLTRKERLAWEKFMDAMDSISIASLSDNKTPALISGGGEIIVEDAEFTLAKELCLEHFNPPTNLSREMNRLEKFLDNCPDHKFQPKLEKGEDVSDK